MTQPSPATQFSFPPFPAASGSSLILLGGAEVVGSNLVLGTAEAEAAAWFAEPVAVSTGWEVRITFQVSGSGAAPQGFAFVIQGDSDAAIGSAGMGVGFAGISQSLAVLIAMTSNPALDQPAAPFISAQSAGTGLNSASSQNSLGTSRAGAVGKLTDGNQHNLIITYTPPEGTSGGVLEVYLDGAYTPVTTATPLNLTGKLGLTSGQAWAGLTSGSNPGTASPTIEIVSWSFAPYNP